MSVRVSASDADSAYMNASTRRASVPSRKPDRTGSSTAKPTAVYRPISEYVAACGSIFCVMAPLSMGSRLLAPTEGAGGVISPVPRTSPRRKANPNPAAVSVPSATGSSVKCCPSARVGTVTVVGGGSARATEAERASAPRRPAQTVRDDLMTVWMPIRSARDTGIERVVTAGRGSLHSQNRASMPTRADGPKASPIMATLDADAQRV